MRTRQQFDDSVKDEIAHAWYYRLMTSKEIEARGIKMTNVHRWMVDRFGPGPRPPAGTVPPPPKNGSPKKAIESESTASIVLETLSRRKIKRGANGRYPDEVREKVTPLLLQKVPVPEIAQKTGINAMTLYLWRNTALKKNGVTQKEPNGAAQEEPKNEGALVVAPQTAAPARIQRIKSKRIEVLTNEATVKAMFDAIDMKENLAHLKKIGDELEAAHKAGEIELDQRDHRLMMVIKRMIGAPMRGARR